MSLVSINVQFPPESKALLKRFEDQPKLVPQAIRRGMDRALQIVAGKIQSERLSGSGPYPPSEHRLGERTGLLKRSVKALPAVVRGEQVTGEIDSDVIYAQVHEFGATIVPRRARFLVFEVDGKVVRAKQVKIPARAPFRYGFLEHSNVFADEIADELQKSGENL